MNEYVESLHLLCKKDTKYDVLYVNTPWHEERSAKDLATLPIHQLTSPNAALFIWADPYAVAKTSQLIKDWGFTFHSVFQTLDIASYPWMMKKTPASSSSKPTPVRKPRASAIKPPTWWSEAPDSTINPSYPTTEQLWLATKGDPSQLFKKSGPMFSVINIPELGKKPGSSKRASETMGDRPLQFLQNVLDHLTDDLRVLNLYTTDLHDQVDSWGPDIPGSFVTAFAKSTGLVGRINDAMRSMTKKDLKQIISANSSSSSSGSGEEKLQSLYSIIESFNGPMVYHLLDGKGQVQPWATRLLQVLARKNLSVLPSAHKKKKRKSADSLKNSDGTKKPCHGIARAALVSPQMADFLGIPHDEKIARTTVVSRLNEYIVKNKLQNPEHKVEVMLDEPLLKLLNPPDDFGKITYFNLCKLVGVHFPKS
ncbi:FirrV-1-B29 [Feldmannia irregularis virus a]|uniref:FirrV-1-B29 n=1 Tax=Feldmannia irregularis virus a TaxID=231992 RepID=Q6XM07_9PHYC|nr:FirrV-1-B29 [Feldmannia irregularis virus a]AAR26904.1 FirrV-1-B29 [Feldmannia irregularis virus a]